MDPVFEDVTRATAEFVRGLHDCFVKMARLKLILNPKKPEHLRTFTAGGVTITAPFEESLAAERWIRYGQGAEMTTDRLNALMRRRVR